MPCPPSACPPSALGSSAERCHVPGEFWGVLRRGAMSPGNIRITPDLSRWIDIIFSLISRFHHAYFCGPAVSQRDCVASKHAMSPERMSPERTGEFCGEVPCPQVIPPQVIPCPQVISPGNTSAMSPRSKCYAEKQVPCPRVDTMSPSR